MPPTPTSFLDLRARQLANQPSWRVRKVVHVPITLRSGRVAACDPLSQPDRAPFEREIPHGIYSVYLYLDAASGDVGYAELRLRDTPVERFELATIPGQDASTLSPTESMATWSTVGTAASPIPRCCPRPRSIPST